MSEFEIPIGSLEEQALKRKERLRNLKRKAETKDTASKSSNYGDGERITLPPAKQLTNENQTDNEEFELVLKNNDVISKITIEANALKEPIVVEEIDIQNLAPRKPDWDLKRDVAKKLDTLERRTQRAIAEIIRERLRSNQDEIDLQAVNIF